MKPVRFEIKNRRYRDDPWSVFTEFRELGEVIPIKFPFFGKGWAATTYEAVNRVFKDDELFVRNPKNAGKKSYGYIELILPRVFKSLVENMLGADGSDHRRLRSVVDQAFARRNIDGMSDRIALLADEQLNLAIAESKGDGTVDLIEHFARPFPLAVICELLGMPMKDRPQFKEWFKPLSDFQGIASFFKISSGIKKMAQYLKCQFEEVKVSPREGLMSDLVQAQFEVELDGPSKELTDKELLAMVFLLFVAGIETTIHLISNSLLTLMQNPAAKQTVCNDWSRCDSALDEVLRHASPLQVAKPRFVARETELFGQPLQKGQMILPMIASANYDPARFQNPLQFDINRKKVYHMSFGSGPHTCLGMKLAKTETYYALHRLYERWPDLQPDFELTHPDWGNRPATRGLKTLMVRVN